MTNTATTATAYLHPRTWGIGETLTEIQVPIRYRKRDHGLGYYVVRADTGQDLGMVSKALDGWRVYALNGAYYTAEQARDIVVSTTRHAEHRESPFKGELITVTRSRGEAADELVNALMNRRAESLEDLVATARAPFLATRAGVS